MKEREGRNGAALSVRSLRRRSGRAGGLAQGHRVELGVRGLLLCYDHVSGGRFRHGTKILRWRADKKPSQCRMDRLRQGSASR